MPKLLFAIPLLCSVATAHADDHDGVGVGPRREGYASGVGVDLRRGELTLSAFAGAYGAHADDFDAASVATSLGVSHVIASHGRAELGLGVRVGWRRDRQDQSDAHTVYDQLGLAVPLRLTLWVTDRVSIHTEIGVEITRTRTRNDWAALVDDSSYVAGGVFGDPLMNLGLTFGF